jgi:cytoskeleton protein RodZ
MSNGNRLTQDLDGRENSGDSGTATRADLSLSSPGARLAAEREHYGLTIEQVASQINLAPRQIHALETDDYAQLPGIAIARGFLRSYAKLLRLDPEPLLTNLVEKNTPSILNTNRGPLSTSFSDSRMRPLNGSRSVNKIPYIVSAVVVALVLAVLAYAFGFLPAPMTQFMSRTGLSSIFGAYSSHAEKVQKELSGTMLSPSSENLSREKSPNGISGMVSLEQGPSAPATEVDNSGSSSMLPSPSPAQKKVLSTDRYESLSLDLTRSRSAAPSNAPIPLVLDVTEDSWLEVKRTDNTILVAKTVKAGSVETVDVDGPVTVTIGNISGVKAMFRNAPLILTDGAKGNTVKLHLK